MRLILAFPLILLVVLPSSLGTNVIMVPVAIEETAAADTFTLHPIAMNQKTYSIVCTLPKRQTITYPFQVEIAGRPIDQMPVAGQSCTQHGSAHFMENKVQFMQSPCFFSKCDQPWHGFIWIPDGNSHLEFQIKGNYSLVKYQSFDFLESLDRGRRLSKRSLRQHYDPQGNAHETWFHVRLAVVISVESFSSKVLKSNISLAIDYAATVINFVNMVYAQVNTSVYLTHLIIWPRYNAAPEIVPLPEQDWIDKMDTILREMGEIVTTHYWPRLFNSTDYVVVFRNLGVASVPVTDSAVLGLSRIRGMCQPMTFNRGATLMVRNGRGDYDDFLTSAAQVAEVTSHEVAHTFGIQHDGDHRDMKVCTCPNSGPYKECLMKVAHKGPDTYTWLFSNCSIKSFQDFIRKTIPEYSQCLKIAPDVNKTQFNQYNDGKSICGNGILEPGEECDCGLMNKYVPNYMTSNICPNPSCCDFNTCKLSAKAKCASGPCCDTKRCDFVAKAKAKRCRPAGDAMCDFAEFCQGNAARCPEDRFALTGTKCPKNGTCHRGKCLSRQDRCEKLMRGSHLPPGESDRCYRESFEYPLIFGNCGHGLFVGNQTVDVKAIIPCPSIEDAECGTLLCVRPDNSIPKMEFAANFGRYFVEPNYCFGTYSYRWPDIGHVPDGMACGRKQDKFCEAFRCSRPMPKNCTVCSVCDQFGVVVARLTTDDCLVNITTASTKTTTPRKPTTTTKLTTKPTETTRKTTATTTSTKRSTTTPATVSTSKKPTTLTSKTTPTTTVTSTTTTTTLPTKTTVTSTTTRTTTLKTTATSSSSVKTTLTSSPTTSKTSKTTPTNPTTTTKSKTSATSSVNSPTTTVTLTTTTSTPKTTTSSSSVKTTTLSKSTTPITTSTLKTTVKSSSTTTTTSTVPTTQTTRTLTNSTENITTTFHDATTTVTKHHQKGSGRQICSNFVLSFVALLCYFMK